MYGIKKACLKATEALCAVDALLDQEWDEEALLDVDRLVQKACQLRDSAYLSFGQNYNWAQGGCRSKESAIESVTNHRQGSIRKAIEREELYLEFPAVSELVVKHKITLDHVDQFAALMRDRIYCEYLPDNIDSLLDNAPHVTASKFSYLVKHWKFAIDNSCRYNELSYDIFRKRTFSLSRLPSGGWNIEGLLDEQTGESLYKAIEDITGKIWRNSSREQREDYAIDQARVDALGYLASGYVNNAFTAGDYSYAAPLTADLTIDVTQIRTDKSVREFVDDCASHKTPLSKAHPKKYLEQILCDTAISLPIKDSDKTYNLGRRVRIAPARMKKQLALENNQCVVEGCCIPARWCDAHHIHHWINGGETKIENLVLLCRRHHTQIHNDATFEQNLSRIRSLGCPQELIDTS